MKNNQIFIMFIAIMSLLLLTACSENEYAKNIYGDDSKIASGGNRNSYFKHTKTLVNNKVDTAFGQFDGIDVIWGIKAAEKGKININFSSKIQQGQFKLVCIDPEKKVTTIFEQSQDGNQEIKVEKGDSLIKIVGCEAKGDIKLEVKVLEGNIKIVGEDDL